MQLPLLSAPWNNIKVQTYHLLSSGGAKEYVLSGKWLNWVSVSLISLSTNYVN